MKFSCGCEEEETKMEDGRVYLKDGSGNKSEQKFIERLKKLGALYYDKEDEKLGGVFVTDKKYGNQWLAVKLYIDGRFQMGTLDKDCNNFNCDEDCYKEEMKWLHTLFSNILSK